MWVLIKNSPVRTLALFGCRFDRYPILHTPLIYMANTDCLETSPSVFMRENIFFEFQPSDTDLSSLIYTKNQSLSWNFKFCVAYWLFDRIASLMVCTVVWLSVSTDIYQDWTDADWHRVASDWAGPVGADQDRSVPMSIGIVANSCRRRWQIARNAVLQVEFFYLKTEHLVRCFFDVFICEKYKYCNS